MGKDVISCGGLIRCLNAFITSAGAISSNSVIVIKIYTAAHQKIPKKSTDIRPPKREGKVLINVKLEINRTWNLINRLSEPWMEIIYQSH